MKPNDLQAALAAELQQERHETVIRYAVTLSGEVAEAFDRLHRDLGGDSTLSRGELTARLLRRMLVDARDSERRARARKVAEPVTAGAEG